MINSNDKTTFDLRMTGIGYIYKITKDNSYLSCSIAAVQGTIDDPEHILLDCKVTGEKEKYLITQCINALNLKKNICISFCLGDLHSVTQDSAGVDLKARLLNISSLKIDEELIYSEKEKSSLTQFFKKILKCLK